MSSLQGGPTKKKNFSPYLYFVGVVVADADAVGVVGGVDLTN